MLDLFKGLRLAPSPPPPPGINSEYGPYMKLGNFLYPHKDTSTLTKIKKEPYIHITKNSNINPASHVVRDLETRVSTPRAST